MYQLRTAVHLYPKYCYIYKKVDEIYVYCSNSDIKQYLPTGIKYLLRSNSLDADATKMNELLKAFATRNIDWCLSSIKPIVQRINTLLGEVLLHGKR